MSPLLSYEESVHSLRDRPDLSQFIEDCYLDADTLKAAKRFADSEEFAAVCEMIERKRDIQGASILDIGCGNGIASYAFATKGALVKAADIDPSASVGLGAARLLSEALPPKMMQCVSCRAEELPFDGELFDIVYARQSLHHLSCLSTAVTQCKRVLKAGGIFIASREHVVNDSSQLQEFLKNHPLHRLHGNENAYPVSHYLDVLKKVGFEVINVLGPYDSVINHFPIKNGEISEWLQNAIARRIGRRMGRLIAEVAFVERAYRRKLSRACNYPGRLYTFVAQKPLKTNPLLS